MQPVADGKFDAVAMAFQHRVIKGRVAGGAEESRQRLDALRFSQRLFANRSASSTTRPCRRSAVIAADECFSWGSARSRTPRCCGTTPSCRWNSAIFPYIDGTVEDWLSDEGMEAPRRGGVGGRSVARRPRDEGNLSLPITWCSAAATQSIEKLPGGVELGITRNAYTGGCTCGRTSHELAGRVGTLS